MTRPKKTTSIFLLLALFIGWAGSLSGMRALPIASPEKKKGDDDSLFAKPSKLSERLKEKTRSGKKDQSRVEVIIQLNGSKMSGGLNALLNRNGAHVKKELDRLGVAVVELPVSAIEELSNYEEVSYVSPDDSTYVLGHVSSTTGTDAAVAQTYSTISQLDGTGVGIAIVDSGVWDSHTSLLNYAGTSSRVIVNRNFVATENRNDDPYGHGTHVAALAAGNDRLKSGAYRGVAPDARLLDLRVLDKDGVGKTSWLLSALDWIAANHAAHNIKVVNLSLGSPAIESYKSDPVCRAIEKLYDLDIVIVAAAGNNGKDSAGQKVYGQIHAPGNSPHAITVGATNTFGTDSRLDDKIATYSSRGPTRSYQTDASGLRRYDNIIKPDLVAPGNKLISAASSNNKLKTENPSLSASNEPDARNDVMYMSGTSMATPLVAGAVALMYEANPHLSAGVVRAILQYTATSVKGFNMLEQGAGQLNVAGATLLADLVRRDLTASTTIGLSLLTAATPTPQSMIAGRNYTWAQGITLEYTYATGSDLITKVQEGYRRTYYITNDVIINANGLIVKDNAKLTAGVSLGANIMTSGGGVLGTGTVIPLNLRGSGVIMTDGVLLADGVLISDGVLLSDGVVLSDGVLLSDGVVLSDGVLLGNSVLINGDVSACMAVAP